jgi:uncharacterized membrane protein YhaH (DUF805 family)
VFENGQLNRKKFWAWISGLLVAKFAIGSLLVMSGPAAKQFGFIDTGIAIAIAVVIGARFKDIGWYTAIGFVMTAVIMFVLPFVLLIAIAPKDSMTLGYIGWPSTLCLVALIIVAGTRPSRVLSAPENAGAV